MNPYAPPLTTGGPFSNGQKNRSSDPDSWIDPDDLGKLDGFTISMVFLINMSWLRDLLWSRFSPAISDRKQEWYRLKNIHASTPAKLKEIQAQRLAKRRVIKDDP